MGHEVRTGWPTGATIYGVVFRPTDGKVWYPAGADWEVFGTDSRTNDDYNAVTMTETASGSGYYRGPFPTAITAAGTYDVFLRLQAGASPVNSDGLAGVKEVQWTGSAVAGGGAAVDAMALSELITEVQALSKRTSDMVLITQSRVANFLNWAQMRIVRRCPGHVDLETSDVSAITLIASTWQYSFASLSPKVFYPLRLYYMDETASVELYYLETDHFDRDFPSPADLADGIPDLFTRRGSSFEIYPVPTAAEAGNFLRLDYTKIPTAFDTDLLSGTSELLDSDEGLIMFATSEAFSAIGNKDAEAAKYMGKFELWLDNYRMDKDSLFMAEGNSLLSDDNRHARRRYR